MMPRQRILAAAGLLAVVLAAAGAACAGEPEAPDEAPVLGRKDTGDEGRFGRPDGYDPSRLLWQMMASVLVILVLGAVAFIIIKRVLPKLGVAQGRRIRIVETVYLGPRKALHLLQVGDLALLVSAARDEVRLVRDVTGFVAMTDEEGGKREKPKHRFSVPPEDAGEAKP